MTTPPIPENRGLAETAFEAPAPAPAPAAKKKLTRSREDKWLGGVCGGLAEYFGVDATWVRIAFIVSTILPGPQFILYFLLWLIIPQDDQR